jgi:hypothetical protein
MPSFAGKLELLLAMQELKMLNIFMNLEKISGLL